MNGMSGSLRSLTAGLVATLCLALVACANEDDNQPGFADSTTPTEGPTSTPTPILTPTPEVSQQLIYINEEKLPPRQPMRDAGPVDATPYRVHTGDGDCLNVRPQPGTSFPTDPRTCVPEGFLLWLFGDPVEIDGFSWRYALGLGWVAVQYVQPDPASKDLLADRAPSLIVSTSDQREEHFWRVEKGGKTTALTKLPATGQNHFTQGRNGQPAYAATTTRDITSGGGSMVVLTRLDTGKQEAIKNAEFIGWSDDGKALLRLYGNGERIAYVIPGSAPVELGQSPSGWSQFAWAPDGESVIVVGEGSAVHAFDVDSRSYRTILPREDSRPYFGELSVSPDGKRILSAPYLGPLQILSLEDGKLSQFQRAAQQSALGGRCGGASGKLSVWLDNDRVAWHESYAQKGSNGITIGNLRTGQRSLIPFFTLQNLERVDARTITFSTSESLDTGSGSGESFTVTWVLDVDSGEARPVTYGASTRRLV